MLLLAWVRRRRPGIPRVRDGDRAAWGVVIGLGLVSPLYDSALRHEGLHALQHVSFLAAGTLVWAALLEPLPGPAWFTAAWKLPYVVAMWLVSLTLSQLFLWSGHPYYTHYTLNDQRAGGGVMLVEGSFVMLGVIVWLLLRVLRESEARQLSSTPGSPPRRRLAPRATGERS